MTEEKMYGEMEERESTLINKKQALTCGMNFLRQVRELSYKDECADRWEREGTQMTMDAITPLTLFLNRREKDC